MEQANLVDILERAIVLAAKAHAGQVDKAGKPYILHPFRVMLKQTSLDGQIVAVLHDVIEDGSEAQAAEVRALLPAELLEAVLCVTKREDEHGEEGYHRFVRRSSANPLARRVKIADLEDNLDIVRLAALSSKDLARVNRYLKALTFLKSCDARAVPPCP